MTNLVHKVRTLTSSHRVNKVESPHYISQQTLVSLRESSPPDNLAVIHGDRVMVCWVPGFLALNCEKTFFRLYLDIEDWD